MTFERPQTMKVIFSEEDKRAIEHAYNIYNTIYDIMRKEGYNGFIPLGCEEDVPPDELNSLLYFLLDFETLKGRDGFTLTR